MYEGLTSELLNLALPPTLEQLRVVSGFITSLDGLKMSGQIDCMIVIGEGTQVPYTEAFKYPIQKVIAVFEVKKRSNKKDYVDAIDHLVRLCDLLPDHLPAGHLSDEAMGRLLGYRPWHGDLHQLKRNQDQFAFRSATLSAYLPLRVIISYHGYSRPETLPRIIEKYLHKEDLSINIIGELPDFILDGDRAFVKLVGLPYAIPIRDGVWLWFASNEDRPLLSLLECLMWRLIPYMDRNFPAFADHDEDPAMNALFCAKITDHSIRLRYFKAEIPCEAQSFHQAESGIHILDWEWKMLFMFKYCQMTTFAEISNFVDQPMPTIKRSVGKLCRLGILFIDKFNVYVNSSSMKTAIGGNDGTYWVGEDCRGRFGRAQLRRMASAKGAEIKALHVVTFSNTNYTPITAATFVASAESAGLIDLVRYRNMMDAKKILDNID